VRPAQDTGVGFATESDEQGFQRARAFRLKLVEPGGVERIFQSRLRDLGVDQGTLQRSAPRPRPSLFVWCRTHASYPSALAGEFIE
jgi:hypothetical protein